MHNRIQQLTRLLFQQDDLAAVSVAELRKGVQQDPWRPETRLLLIKKLQLEKDPSWKTEWQQSTGYFTDPLWLQYLFHAESTPAKKPAVTAESQNEELIFTPYHTVDYFASQGIQIKADETPQDKFGQQLKSFTDWLKVMKRLPLSEIGKSVDPKEERKVEQMAGHSLAQEEVVTEAMAAVWIKQGNLTKAEEVYRKLSLLEPSKSAYFASKIKALHQK